MRSIRSTSDDVMTTKPCIAAGYAQLLATLSCWLRSAASLKYPMGKLSQA